MPKLDFGSFCGAASSVLMGRDFSNAANATMDAAVEQAVAAKPSPGNAPSF